MSTVQRILLPDTSLTHSHILNAVGVADRLCGVSGTRDVIFPVPAKPSLTSGSLHQALGATIHNALVKDKPVTLPSGAQMRCETIKTLQFVTKPSVLIAVFANQAMMDKVDSLQGLLAVLAVPWTQDAIENWVKT